MRPERAHFRPVRTHLRMDEANFRPERIDSRSLASVRGKEITHHTKPEPKPCMYVHDVSI